MKPFKSLILAGGLGLAFLAGIASAPAADQENPKPKPKYPPPKQATPIPRSPIRSPDLNKPPIRTPETVKPPLHNPDSLNPAPNAAKPALQAPDAATTLTPGPHPNLETKTTASGGYIKTTPSGKPREIMETKPNGEQHTEYRSPAGSLEKKVVQNPNGTTQTLQYAPNGNVKQEILRNPAGQVTQTTDRQAGLGGNPRAVETVKYGSSGQPVAKTVVVKQTTVLVKNTTIINNNTTIINNQNHIVNNTTIERNYDRRRYGYVYHPDFVVYRPYYVSWYDPYWYPGGVLVVHPFLFAWGWEDAGWYHYHRHYWTTYEVYPAPCYWVTDWMIAGYVADRYVASISFEQAQQDARLAHEEAERARLVAEQARDQAEIAEARAAQAQAELRAKNAEERAARAERQEAQAKSGQANPNATPIDEKTKEALKNQIEKEIATKKEIADQAAKGGAPIIPDLSQALADPHHIFAVSKPITVISAKDRNPAGTLTEGDLLQLEPGQDEALKNASEKSFINMRVMTSKGEEGEALAGTVIQVSLKDLQDFDSEFRAKLDLGLAEADKNKAAFKTGAK